MNDNQYELTRILDLIEKGTITPNEGYRIIQEMGNIQPSNYMAVILDKPGTIQDIPIKTVTSGKPQGKELQILVKAFALNFGDLLCVKGLYPTMPEYPFTPGFEVSGVVMKTGSEVSLFEPGDEVIGLMGSRMGGQQSVVNTFEHLVVKKPRNVTFEEACAFPIVFTTVQHVFEVAQIKKGDKVLIHTAAGGIGLIAVQMAQQVGAECFVTAGSQEKLEYLKKLNMKHLINYREEDFAERIREITDGYGVDVVINTLGGDAIQKGIDLLAPGGRYMEIAQTGLHQSGKLDLSRLVHNQTFHSVDLRRLVLQQPERIQNLLESMYRALSKGKIRPTVGQTFPMQELQQAYQCLESRSNIGKIVVIPETGTFAEKLIPAYVTKLASENMNTHMKDMEPPILSGRTPVQSTSNREVAVIGLSCRFPGAKNANAYWNNLSRGLSSIREVPAERWKAEDYYDSDPDIMDKTSSKWGGFLDEIDLFDAQFFNMSGKEAELTDPQQRLFLEESWSALEDAGYANDSVSNKKCAVFAGVGSSDYMMNVSDAVEPQSLWGNESSILPARISYLLNMKGPSVALNTACSSSLVAIHLACQSIQNDECEMAIAGGAFISTTPYFHIAASNAGMLSPDGRCSTFDEVANGFVPGEGVAAIVLKDIEAALRDGDHIYGVIKGSGINQDGKTNGITAPSTISQTELELEVYRKAGIHPEDIQYVEAHGTGTKLGDPIEIEALTNAYRQYTEKKQYCPIGSVKTNIGHASAAAGIASVIKVLLSLKNQQLPPSLNYEHCNQHIDLAESPFYVLSKLEEWKGSPDKPRLATVSSFGFSGTNAHLILAEAPLRKSDQVFRPFYLIPLSAKSMLALHQKATDLLQWIKEKEQDDLLSLSDISYTLGARRKHFSHRSCYVVRDLEELKKCLTQFSLDDACKIVQQLKSSEHRRIQHLAERIGLNEQNDSSLQVQMEELAKGYLDGCDPQWEVLFGKMRPATLSMPTYPFDREHYWFKEKNEKNIAFSSSYLHPLVHANTSTLEEQTFTTVFSIQDQQVKDHVIQGVPIFPAAAYVEMALAAVQLSARENYAVIKNIGWFKPLIIHSASKVHVSLYPKGRDIEFDIWSSNLGDDELNEEKVVHVSGVLMNNETAPAPKCLDLQVIRSRCFKMHEGSSLYKWFMSNGFNYGPGYQTIEYLDLGKDEALATLKTPLVLGGHITDYHLHPAFLDGALQTVMGMMYGKENNVAYLPYSLDRLEVFQPSTIAAYAYVKKLSSISSLISRFEVQLLDEDGNEIARLNGFVVRAQNAVSARSNQESIYYHRPVWTEQPLPLSVTTETLPPGDVVLLDTDDVMYRKLKEQLQGKRVVLIQPGDQFEELEANVYRLDPSKDYGYRQIFDRFDEQGILPSLIIHNWSTSPKTEDESISSLLNRGLFSVFNLTQGLMEHKGKGIQSPCLLYVYPGSENHPADVAIGGWIRSLIQEHPDYQFACIETDGHKALDELCLQEWCACWHDQSGPNDTSIRYKTGERFALQQESVILREPKKRSFVRERGVYLITGGMGAIGYTVACSMAAQAQVKLVLIGRSPETTDISQKLDALNHFGGEAIYIQCDISDPKEAMELILNIKQRYGALHGVLHAAGVLSDGLIRNKKKEDMMAVLAAKVYGTQWLDLYTSKEQLDCFILFSSLASIVGNVGQSDYAYANAFLDAFSEKRIFMELEGIRNGKTIVVNWPLWLDGGGMQIKPDIIELMKENGLSPISREQGLYALNTISEQSSGQWIVLGSASSPWSKTSKQEINNVQVTKKVTGVNKQLGEHLTDAVMKHLIQVLATETRISASKIMPDEPLETYGIDSAMIVNMTRVLEKNFGTLSKTLFFEYQNLSTLASYFVEQHTDKLQEMFDMSGGIAPVSADVVSGSLESQAPSKRRTRNDRRFKKDVNRENAQEPIAIIGMSGRYPMADTLDEFWDNLKEGKDSIVEIPTERWSVSSSLSYSKWGGFIRDVDKFDAKFFQISPREAALMDPQERLFLQVVWHTLEDAGYTRSRLKSSKTGVYVGVMYGQYQLYGAQNAMKGEGFVPSSSFASVANRVSYFLDLQGPSMAVDTMCSSSLTAIHLACRSLNSGECETALVGGVNVSIHPYKYHLLSQGKFASTDGRCRSFGEGGDGYVPGEGVGAVMLKPLRKALEDGDQIHGVIRGTALNHGGKTNGYSVPNPNAQATCISEALKNANINAREVSYVEAHGTGTALGDPIEITALQRAYSQYTEDKQFCAIGSVKSNIGHLESASGIAGITKILLQMKNKKIVPSLHSQKLNPNIQFEQTPFTVQQELKDWNTEGSRIAAISSFGAGGSNAHVILEEWTEEDIVTSTVPAPFLFVLSAKQRNSLYEVARQLYDYLQTHSQLDMASIAWTLQSGREPMQERVAIIATHKDELSDLLRSYVDGVAGKNTFEGSFKQEMVTSQYQGKAVKGFLEAVTTDRDLEQLARLWISGVYIEWEILYDIQKLQRISLPGYPFEKERHWIELPNEIAHSEVLAMNAQEKPIVPNLMKRPASEIKFTPDELLTYVTDDLRILVGEVLQLSPERIDLDESLTDFGFDSVTLKELADRLSKRFSIPISPSIFFEQGEVRSLAKSLIRDYTEELRVRYESENMLYDHEQIESIPTFERNSVSQLSRKKENLNITNHDAIAVIGMSGQFPQSSDLQQFWKQIESETDLITEIPSDRWDWHAYASKEGTFHSRSRWGGFLNDVDKFDPRFFQISPYEAEMMDPQQRLALQTVWHTFEDAGYKPSDFSGHRVGLFIGAQFQDYLQLLHDDGELNAVMGTGNELSILVNRISYLLNFHGPSEPYNTACSSSSVAVHRAIQSLRTGESEVAVAGGISLILAPYAMISAGEMGILSTDGRCKTLDKQANGYVKGEGVGMLLLKPLSKAMEDKDNIYAVLRGSAVNHGGKAQSLTAPNSEAQAEVLMTAYEDAGIDPSTVGYLELHGTGTELGDPIEIEGIKKAFKRLSEKSGHILKEEAFCGIGSVKTNIGHLEPASGIAGIIKVILSMNHRRLPGLLHFRELNPYVNLDRSPFYIVQKTQEWKRLKDEQGDELPLRAGVSSFGFGGVNAHIILEEAPVSLQYETRYQSALQSDKLFVLSAKSEERLREYAENFLLFLEDKRNENFNNVQVWGEKIAGQISEIIKVQVDDLDWDEPFEEYGVGQEELTALLQRVTGRYDLTVTLSLLRDYSSIVQLANYVLRLSEDISDERSDSSEQSGFLGNLSYTLQIGREEMNVRLAIVASNVTEIINKLQLYLDRKQSVGLYLGEVKRIQETQPLEDEYTVENQADLSLDVIANQWVNGESVDWIQISDLEKVCRIPIPLYPFAKERYWAPKPSSVSVISGKEIAVSQEALIETPSILGGQEQLAVELRYIIADKLKLKPDEIEDNIELSEYGVDSMLSSMIVQIVQERFGEAIDMGVIVEYPTIKGLSTYLADKIEPQHMSRSAAVPPVNFNKPKLPPEIIPINTKGTKQISFWIHGATGYPNVFNNLSKALGPDYPLYSFLAKGTDGKSIPRMFDDMVLHYLECIRLIQPKGPYFLGGHSFGGLVAMEIARKLKSEGEEILHLVMLDTYPTTSEVNDQFYETYDFDFLKLYLVNSFLKVDQNPSLVVTSNDLEGIPKRFHVAHLAKLAKERSNKLIEADEIFNFIKGGLLVSDFAEETYLVHKPALYDASNVTFIKTTKGFVGPDNNMGLPAVDILKDYDYSLFWKEIICSNLDVLTVDSDHNSLLDHPVLPYVSEKIEVLLGKTHVPLDVNEYDQFKVAFTKLTEYGHFLLLHAFKTMGVFKSAGEKYTKDKLLEELNVIPEYHRLFSAMIEIMVQKGWLEIHDGLILTTKILESKALKKQLKEIGQLKTILVEEYSEIKSYIPLLEVCSNAYSEVLSGSVDHMNVIFPNGSMQYVADVYKGNIQSDYYNHLLTRLLHDSIRKRLNKYPHTHIQILEIGAGTGGASAFIFESVKEFAAQIRYVYSDISSAFIQYGRKEFGSAYPFVDYRVLNIEKDPELQGYEPHSFDFIVCSNVLHTTRVMSNTLQHIHSLLKESGEVLINELTQIIDYNTLTFGLTSGWWLYTDEDERIENSPLLSTELWNTKLKEVGFYSVQICGTPNTSENELPQSIIIGKNRGK